MAQRLFKTALVLSGGSARGLTHLGVLDEVQKHGFKVDIIVGASMGAVVGALYAYYGDVAMVVEKMRALVESDIFLRTISIAREDVPEIGPDGFFNRFMWLFRKGVYYTHSMMRPALVQEETYQDIMNDLIPDHPIEKLEIPFAAVAMDFITGEEIVMRTGSLRKAVAASSAIPGLLPPIHFNGRILVDGGWVDNVPVAPAIAMGAHFVLAVDASLDILGLGPPPISAIESLFRCNEITRIILMRERKASADVLLVPKIDQILWSNFACIDHCSSAGRDVLRENLKLIRRKKRLRRLQTLMGILHPVRREKWRHPFVMS